MNNTEGKEASSYKLLAYRMREKKSILLSLAIGLLGTTGIYAFSKGAAWISALAPVFLALGAILLIAAFRNWQLGLQALLVIVVIEGAVRKWFLPSATELVYFYKDALMVIILIGYRRQHRKTPFLIKRPVQFFSLALTLFVAYAIALMIMPGGPDVLIGLLGVKAYCLYMPLAFMVPRAFASKEKVIGFLKWYSLIVLPVAAVGVMQFLDTNPRSVLNRYAVNEEASSRAADIATFYGSSGQGFVRITSTFSYVSGLSIYLPIMFALLLSLTSFYSIRHLSRSVRALYYLALGAVVVLSFMTGSRGSVLAIAIIAVIFYWFASKKNLFRRLQHIAIIGALIYMALTTLFPQAYDAFYTRAFGETQRVDEGLSRITRSFDFPAKEASFAGAFGYGIGLTQNAVPALKKRFNLTKGDNPIPIGYEGEPGRVMLELGIIGFLLYTALRLVILLTLCRVCMSIRDPESKLLAIAILGALIFPLLIGGAVVSHTQNVYQWFLIGMMLALFNQERLSLYIKAADERAAFRPARQFSITPERGAV
jgi:hypothetical protein